MIDINLAKLKVKLEHESVVNVALNDLKRKFETYFNILKEYVKAFTGYYISIGDEKFPFKDLVHIDGVKICRVTGYFPHIYIDINLDKRNIFGFRKKLKMRYCCCADYWSIVGGRSDATVSEIDMVKDSIVDSIDELQLKIREVRNIA